VALVSKQAYYNTKQNFLAVTVGRLVASSTTTAFYFRMIIEEYIMQNFMDQFDTVSNSEAGSKLHFVTPSGDLAYIGEGEKKPMTVTMQGASGSMHKSHAAAAVRKSRIDAKKKRNKKDDEEFTVKVFEDIADGQTSRLVAVVTSWENIYDEAGKSLECTKENVKFIFGKYQALRLQAINFLDDEVNFIKS